MVQCMTCDGLMAVCCDLFALCMGPPPSTCAAGILICEGEEQDVAEFVQRLRALRWKAMAVRLKILQSGLDAHSEC